MRPSVRLHIARGLAPAGIVGPVLFTALVLLQGWLVPDYSHVALPISALTAWPSGWIQILNFCVAGVLLILFGSALHLALEASPRGAVGAGLLIAGGVGIVLAGVFPWVMVNGVPTETPAHVVGAMTAFASTGLGFVVLSGRLRADPQWADLARYTRGTGIVVLILFVAVGFFAVDDGTPLHPWAGLLQRILCVVWFTCLIVVALRLRRVTDRARPDP